MANGKKVKPDNNRPAAGGQPVPVPQIDTAGLVELASKLTEYYGGGAGTGYRVERRRGPDGSMELVIAPVSGDKRTFVITYTGQPDAQGFVSGTLKIDENNAVPVRFHPRLGKNYLAETDAKKFSELLAAGSSESPEKPDDKKDNEKKEPNTATFQFFNPFQQPALVNPNPATGTTPNTVPERTPSFWEKLSDSLASSLPLLISLLLMSSNRSEE